MSRKALFPGLLGLATLALATGCERALPPDPPANLEKAQEIRAGLVGEEEAAVRRPHVAPLAQSLREAPSFLGPRPRLQS